MDTQNQLPQVQGNHQLNYFDIVQFEHVQRVAKMFAKSNLAPDQYNLLKSPETAISNTIIALDMANRLNANPLMVMQNLVIVYNRPSWSSTFLIATINSSGRFETLRYRVEKTETNLKGMEYTDYEWNQAAGKKKPVTKTVQEDLFDITCICYTKDKQSDELLESSPISIRMAILEGWYYKDGSKWKSMPEQMLRYRSASFWQRVYAPEVAMGMMTEDEVYDMTNQTVDTEIISQETIPANEIKEKLGETIIVMNPDQAVGALDSSNAKPINLESTKKDISLEEDIPLTSKPITGAKKQETVVTTPKVVNKEGSVENKITQSSKDNDLGSITQEENTSALRSNTLFDSNSKSIPLSDEEPQF